MEEKAKKVSVWRIIKWTFFSISVLVYLLIFIRLFYSCDADISDDIILTSAEKVDFENLDIDYALYNYQPSAWTNDDGTIQLKNIYYIEPISELQLTVRYRISSYDTNEQKKPFDFKIRTVEGNSDEQTEVVFEDIELHTQSRFNYKYIRICCPNIEIDDGKRETVAVQKVDEDGNVTYDTKTEIVGGNKVYLDIYDSHTQELLYSFLVAGKSVGGIRTRRNKCDVKIIE